MSDQQVSIPFVLILLIAVGLVTRHLFFSPSATSPSAAGARGARDAARRREAAVERIQQMFPQADRRAVLWDLARNGMNVQVTSERILAGRLETPPITFQPPPPPGSNNAAAAPAQKKPRARHPDLITRYNLQSKLSEVEVEEVEEVEEEQQQKKKKDGWSASKEERQALLKRRREEMILAARRRMVAQMAAERDAVPQAEEVEKAPEGVES